MTHEGNVVAQEAEVISLDLRGFVCPEPLERVAEATKHAHHGQRIEAVVDFSPAVLTITSLAIREPWDISVQGIGPGLWKLTLAPREGIAG
ncbi:MAG: sulfurtransferase TusA family protein [Chloroflexi bacterium]|nr:sulfurtransferase TusA family protein [Chloroflexota bacterium]